MIQETIDKLTKMLGVIALFLIIGFIYNQVWKAVVPKFKHFTASPEGEVISSVEIENALAAKLGHAPVHFAAQADSLYLAPAPGEVWDLIKNITPQRSYRSEVYDCDDFARQFSAALALEWAGRGERLPLPILTVWAVVQFHDGTIGGHAFNGIIMSSGKIVWIEPQAPGIYRHLKLLEIASITL